MTGEFHRVIKVAVTDVCYLYRVGKNLVVAMF
jgi:hypothetical protein